MKIIRRGKTAEKCGNVALITVDRWADDPRYAHLKFPKKVRLGDSSVGFVEQEINDWLAAKAAERDDVDADGNDALGEDDDDDEYDERPP